MKTENTDKWLWKVAERIGKRFGINVITIRKNIDIDNMGRKSGEVIFVLDNAF